MLAWRNCIFILSKMHTRGQHFILSKCSLGWTAFVSFHKCLIGWTAVVLFHKCLIGWTAIVYFHKCLIGWTAIVFFHKCLIGWTAIVFFYKCSYVDGRWILDKDKNNTLWIFTDYYFLGSLYVSSPFAVTVSLWYFRKDGVFHGFC